MKSIKHTTFAALAALMTVSPVLTADRTNLCGHLTSIFSNSQTDQALTQIDESPPNPFASITSSQNEPFQSRIDLQQGSQTELPRHLFPGVKAFFEDVQKSPRYRMYLSRINKLNKEEVLNELKEDLYIFFLQTLENKQAQSMAFGSGSTQFNIDPKKLNAKVLEATTELMILITADVKKRLKKLE